MTAPTPVRYDSMLPVRFDAPLLNPAPQGLYAVTQWTDETTPARRWRIHRAHSTPPMTYRSTPKYATTATN